MPDKLSYQNLFPQLAENNITILTPNRRLAATMHKLYQEFQRHQQIDCWQTPDILPITSWLQRFWQDLTCNERSTSPHLLNAAQEQYLWEKIILSSKQSDQLLQISETADIAQSAWELLKQWRVDFQHPLFSSAEDYAALKHWASEFSNLCKKNNWVDNASIAEIIGEKIVSGTIKPAHTIILAGFTEHSPQTRQLLECCRQVGSEIIELETANHSTSRAMRIGLTEAEDEIIAMAQWAKTVLNNNREAKIGCVVPALDKSRDRVLQVFSEVFATDNMITVDPEIIPFNISAGKSLPQFPVINTALQLLTLHKQSISIEILGHLLSSPFLGDAESERIKRAKYDTILRKNNLKIVNLSDENKKTSITSNVPLLAKRISRFFSLLNSAGKAMTYSEWAGLFSRLLTAAGWPGERSLNSVEYQVVECWLDLLSAYSTLDQISNPVKLPQAVSALQKMAGNTVFQPKTPEATIQVLGVLEAAGLPFDYLWVAGMDDISWPPQPKPNPFIPKPLQRELQMPHATAERELFFCKNLISQFQQCAKTVIFSHAEKNEELELQASPLIREINEASMNELHLPAFTSNIERVYTTKNLEKLNDENAPSYATDVKVQGGVDVLKQQALCPFKAFATHRLHARELESPLTGMRAKDRGNILHKALELAWKALKDQNTLTAMPDDELDNLIQNCVHSALTFTTNAHTDALQYITLEKQRLHKLIRSWLDIEKSRPLFKVSDTEIKCQTTISKLTFDIRIDRIDELDDGSKLVIDYKSGKNNDINSWFSDRPEEPQLPVYVLLDPEKTSGLSFAQLFPGDHGFKGISSRNLDIKGFKTIEEINKEAPANWKEQISQWQTILTKLSDDFYSGAAKVDPKDPAQTCNWCALKPLCRINEEL